MQLTQATTQIPIEHGSLVLLSGVPGSGKSYSTRTLAPELVISSDKLRTQFGYRREMQEGYPIVSPTGMYDEEVWGFLHAAVKKRMQNGMTTFVDAMLLNDKKRAPLAKYAEQYNRPIHVVIFDRTPGTVLVQNQQRKAQVPTDFIMKKLGELRNESRWPYTVITEGDVEFELKQFSLDFDGELDIIGDVHGNLFQLNDLLETLGYDESFVHTEGRRLMFVGDYVDRGAYSLEVLELIGQAMDQGHYATIGNHDYKLLKALRTGEATSSRTTNATLHTLLCLREQDRKYFMGILSRMVPYYRRDNELFCHAPVSKFDLTLPLNSFIYGEFPRDYDASHNTDAFFNATGDVLYRGHCPPNSDSRLPNVKVLDLGLKGAGFGGPIVSYSQGKEEFIMSYDTPDCRLTDDATLESQFAPLLKQKLIRKASMGNMCIYKYTSKAFFDKDAWRNHGELLSKARGIVLGLNGNPINAPFPRTFNYKEQGTFANTHPASLVTLTRKINGFLGQVFRNPYTGELVYAASGSFESEYASLVKAELKKAKLIPALYAYLAQAPFSTTLLFEIVSKDDPNKHPIADETGCWLIGKGCQGHAMADEAELDRIAEMLPGAQRPEWIKAIEWLDALVICNKSRHEGFMVRNVLTGEFFCKLKTPHYLVKKLMGRLSKANAHFMWKNPRQFKANKLKDSEELWPIVDRIVEEYDKETWLDLSDDARFKFVECEL